MIRAITASPLLIVNEDLAAHKAFLPGNDRPLHTAYLLFQKEILYLRRRGQ
jgi:hypothetical protein